MFYKKLLLLLAVQSASRCFLASFVRLGNAAYHCCSQEIGAIATLAIVHIPSSTHWTFPHVWPLLIDWLPSACWHLRDNQKPAFCFCVSHCIWKLLTTIRACYKSRLWLEMDHHRCSSVQRCMRCIRSLSTDCARLPQLCRKCRSEWQDALMSHEERWSCGINTK